MQGYNYTVSIMLYLLHNALFCFIYMYVSYLWLLSLLLAPHYTYTIILQYKQVSFPLLLTSHLLLSFLIVEKDDFVMLCMLCFIICTNWIFFNGCWKRMWYYDSGYHMHYMLYHMYGLHLYLTFYHMHDMVYLPVGLIFLQHIRSSMLYAVVSATLSLLLSWSLLLFSEKFFFFFCFLFFFFRCIWNMALMFICVLSQLFAWYFLLWCHLFSLCLKQSPDHITALKENQCYHCLLFLQLNYCYCYCYLWPLD